MEGDDQQEGQLEGVFNINDKVLAIVGAWDRADPMEVVKIWIGDLLLQLPQSFPSPQEQQLMNRPATHASAPFVADHFARRLANYFWRLWSCESLMRSLSGTQIHLHVKAISEGGNIRTTPRGSSRESRDLQTYYTTSQTTVPLAPIQKSSSMPPVGTSVFSPSKPSEGDDGSSTPTATSPDAVAQRVGQEKGERRTLHPIRPPPILKKMGSSGSSQSTSRSPVIGTSQIIAEGGESKVPESDPATGDKSSITSTGSPPTTRYISTRFSEEVAVSIPQPLSSTSGEKAERSARSFGDSSRGSSKRGHVVHGGSAASRKRPIVMRQRSSQVSSAGKPSQTSPSLGPERKTDMEDEETTVTASTERRRRAVSPHPGKLGRLPSPTASPEEDEDDDEEEEPAIQQSKEKEDKTAKETTTENNTANIPSTQISPPLVDPDFRSRFASQTRAQQHRSFTNLPSAAWRSAATTSTATSYNASGMMFPEQASSSGRRGSARTAFKDEIIPLKAPAPAGPDVTDDTKDATGLPRTKSQLTLLLERNKAAGHESKGKEPAT